MPRTKKTYDTAKDAKTFAAALDNIKYAGNPEEFGLRLQCKQCNDTEKLLRKIIREELKGLTCTAAKKKTKKG